MLQPTGTGQQRRREEVFFRSLKDIFTLSKQLKVMNDRCINSVGHIFLFINKLVIQILKGSSSVFHLNHLQLFFQNLQTLIMPCFYFHWVSLVCLAILILLHKQFVSLPHVTSTTCCSTKAPGHYAICVLCMCRADRSAHVTQNSAMTVQRHKEKNRL